MAFPPQRQGISHAIDVTISSGTAITSAVPLYGRTLVGLYMPAAWTAAAITFQACDTEAGTFVELIATGASALSLTVAASQYIAIDPINFWGVKFIKVRSGTSGTPVNQGADRAIVLMTADLIGR